MAITKTLILERSVGSRIHRTIFKKGHFGPASTVITLWERATKMGINLDLKDLFDQVRSKL